MMRKIQISPPAIEPVSLAEARDHLRITGEEEDAAIESLIVTARIAVETDTRRVLMAQEWRAVVNEPWPDDGRLELPVVPLLQITQIRLVAEDGSETVQSASEYEVETERSILAWNSAPAEIGSSWLAGELQIDFTAGYGLSGDDVPAPLRYAIMMLVAHWFETRSMATIDGRLQPAPETYGRLIAPYRRLALC